QIHYSADGGETWSLVADNVVGESYVWTAPMAPTENGLVRVGVLDDLGVMGNDSSDQPFSIRVATGIEPPLPMTYHLYQNKPNPLENATQIAFDLPIQARVSLRVYDLSGRGVKILKEDAFPAGRHTVSWDARDASGHPVAAGIYFLRIEANQFTDTKLMQVQR
ncbi:MAG TPA: FlgD immunoglobulin-like domain containing protein, partial [Candidatus Eisenbacteria bacterium]|nr:FlgD immunoglobulin-like domain containing protein [Candidatus Eisenbacteria bacterium]